MNRKELLKAAKPILFNTEMVRAILKGRKTETRRVIKFPENKFTGETPKANDIEVYPKTIYSDEVSFSINPFYCMGIKPPYRRGDILYVRETWCKVGTDVDKIHFEHSGSMWDGMYLYKADGHDLSDIGKWHPSIHMPKEAARIFPQVTNLRAERLQDITESQAIAEGVKDLYEDVSDNDYWETTERDNLLYNIAAFPVLWDNTISQKDQPLYGWAANPWVWVVEFEKLEVGNE